MNKANLIAKKLQSLITNLNEINTKIGAMDKADMRDGLREFQKIVKDLSDEDMNQAIASMDAILELVGIIQSVISKSEDETSGNPDIPTAQKSVAAQVYDGLMTSYGRLKQYNYENPRAIGRIIHVTEHNEGELEDLLDSIEFQVFYMRQLSYEQVAQFTKNTKKFNEWLDEIDKLVIDNRYQLNLAKNYLARKSLKAEKEKSGT